MGTEFGHLGRLHNSDLAGIDSSFLKRLFNVNAWQMRSGEAVMDDEEYLHILDFPRLLSPRLSQTTLPADGYAITFAQRVSKLILVLLSLPFVEHRHNQLTAERFYKSEFGAALHEVCRAPFNNLLAPHWSANTRQATTLWIMDLVDLFEIHSQFVQTRTGAGLAHTFTLLEDEHTRAGPFVAASSVIPTMTGGRRDNLFVQLASFRREAAERWDRARYNGNERMWGDQLNLFILPERSTMSRFGPEPKKPKRDRSSKDPTPFTARQPLFEF